MSVDPEKVQRRMAQDGIPVGTNEPALLALGARRLPPRAFVLRRAEDVTGVSGTGVVAEGVEFSDGTVALRWLSDWPTSVVFHDRGIESVRAVHGHGGKTRIEWVAAALNGTADHDDEARVKPTAITPAQLAEAQEFSEMAERIEVVRIPTDDALNGTPDLTEGLAPPAIERVPWWEALRDGRHVPHPDDPDASARWVFSGGPHGSRLNGTEGPFLSAWTSHVDENGIGGSWSGPDVPVDPDGMVTVLAEGSADTADLPPSDVLARMFHESYEQLAPDYGYKTREASAVPWDDVPDQNKRLMVATCEAVLAAVGASTSSPARRALGELLDQAERCAAVHPDNWAGINSQALVSDLVAAARALVASTGTETDDAQ